MNIIPLPNLIFFNMG